MAEHAWTETTKSSTLRSVFPSRDIGDQNIVQSDGQMDKSILQSIYKLNVSNWDKTIVSFRINEPFLNDSELFLI